MNTYKNALMILPVLSLLSLSPHELGHKFTSRSIASADVVKPVSIEQIKKETSEIKAVVEDHKKDPKSDNEIALKICLERLNELEKSVPSVKKENKPSNKKESDLKVVKKEIHEVKSDLTEIINKNDETKDHDNKDSKKKSEIVENKDLSDEDDKVLKKPSDDNKKDHKIEVCSDQPQNQFNEKLLKLIEQQNTIMSSMMNFLNQKNQANLYGINFLPQVQFLPHNYQYQYAPQTTAGNWVYYPNGYNPSQGTQPMPGTQPISNELMNNIPHQNTQAQHGQSQQPVSEWGLAPQTQLQFNQDPRFNVMPIQPGIFGNNGFSFNFTPNMNNLSQNQNNQVPSPQNNFLNPNMGQNTLLPASSFNVDPAISQNFMFNPRT